MSIFGFGKKQDEETKSGCCCEASYNSEEMKAAEECKCNGGIKVLGGGCAKCHELEANTKAALDELGISENVELITDFSVIATYGVMSTPALVIDNKVVSYGKVLKKDEIIRLYKDVRG
jgi:small redox-active disulfide protein 2